MRTPYDLRLRLVESARHLGINAYQPSSLGTPPAPLQIIGRCPAEFLIGGQTSGVRSSLPRTVTSVGARRLSLHLLQ